MGWQKCDQRLKGTKPVLSLDAIVQYLLTQCLWRIYRPYLFLLMKISCILGGFLNKENEMKPDIESLFPNP